jgi:hypothetical protein
MGGKVLVESQVGMGSIFSMTFKVMYQIIDDNDESGLTRREYRQSRVSSESKDSEV